MFNCTGGHVTAPGMKCRRVVTEIRTTKEVFVVRTSKNGETQERVTLTRNGFEPVREEVFCKEHLHAAPPKPRLILGDTKVIKTFVAAVEEPKQKTRHRHRHRED